MHNAHIIRTAECALATIEHIESVPYEQGRKYYVINRLYSSNLRRLQRCKSALRADATFTRLAITKRNAPIHTTR